MKDFRIKSAGELAEVFVYGDIGGGVFGGITALEFADKLKEVKGRKLAVRINSYGGDIFEAFAIAEQLKRWKGRVDVSIDGIAASAASIVAMQGQTIAMGEGSQLMIHNPWTIVAGGADEMRKTADVLETTARDMAAIYSARSGRPVHQVQEWMAEETYFTGPDAVEAGFADSVTEAPAVAACGGDWRRQFGQQHISVYRPTADDTSDKAALLATAVAVRRRILELDNSA